jgi:hypothetical protein
MIYSQKVYRGVELLKEIKEFEDRLEGSEDKSERTVLAEEIERCRKELRAQDGVRNLHSIGRFI